MESSLKLGSHFIYFGRTSDHHMFVSQICIHLRKWTGKEIKYSFYVILKRLLADILIDQATFDTVNIIQP